MKPQKIYASVLAQEALNQFNKAMESEYTVQGALMPDAHSGYTLPIGAVIATRDMVFPSYVGYDIGCGMCAVKTDFSLESIVQNADMILEQIFFDIPVGFRHRNQPVKSEIDYRNLTPDAQKIFSKKKKGFVSIGYSWWRKSFY